MYKLVASDLDGTLLLNGSHQLNPEVFDLILRLRERGIPFIAASGRQIASIRNLFSPIADKIHYISENGAICLINNELIVTAEIQHELALRICHEILKRKNCNLIINCVTTSYIFPDDEDFIYHIQHELNNDTTIIQDLSEIQEPIVKVAAQDHADCLSSAKYFHDLFSSEIKVVTSGNDWIDFIPYGCNKGVALQTALDKLGICAKDVIVFGDQQNDLEMLKLAGTSYAMATASSEVKSAATAVTDSVEKILRTI